MSGIFSADVAGLAMGSEQCQDISKDTDMRIFMVQRTEAESTENTCSWGRYRFSLFFPRPLLIFLAKQGAVKDIKLYSLNLDVHLQDGRLQHSIKRSEVSLTEKCKCEPWSLIFQTLLNYQIQFQNCKIFWNKIPRGSAFETQHLTLRSPAY